MNALITVTGSGGKTGRCDAKCYNAKHPKCTCICGGVNHGVGLKQAVKNTKHIADELADQMQPDQTVSTRIPQAMLF